MAAAGGRWPAALGCPLHDAPKKEIAVYVCRAMRAVESCALGLELPPGHEVRPLGWLTSRVTRRGVEELYMRYFTWHSDLPPVRRTALGLDDPAAGGRPPLDDDEDARMFGGPTAAEEEEREADVAAARSRWQHPQTCYKRLRGRPMSIAHTDARADFAATEEADRRQLAAAERTARRAASLQQHQEAHRTERLLALRRREHERACAAAGRRISKVRLTDTEHRRVEELDRQGQLDPSGPPPPEGHAERLRWEVRDHPALQDAVFAEERGDVHCDEAAGRARAEREEQLLRRAWVIDERQAAPSPAKAARR